MKEEIETLSQDVLRVSEKARKLNIKVRVVPDAPGRDFVTTEVTVNGALYTSSSLALPTAHHWKKLAQKKAFGKLIDLFNTNFKRYDFERVTPFKSGKKKQIRLF